MRRIRNVRRRRRATRTQPPKTVIRRMTIIGQAAASSMQVPGQMVMSHHLIRSSRRIVAFQARHCKLSNLLLEIFTGEAPYLIKVDQRGSRIIRLNNKTQSGKEVTKALMPMSRKRSRTANLFLVVLITTVYYRPFLVALRRSALIVYVFGSLVALMVYTGSPRTAHHSLAVALIR